MRDPSKPLSQGLVIEVREDIERVCERGRRRVGGSERKLERERREKKKGKMPNERLLGESDIESESERERER